MFSLTKVFMKGKVLLSSAYLAPVQYYSKMLLYPEVLVEQHDHYMKQTYRNRCVIATQAGTQALTVPVELDGKPKTFMRDVRISSHGAWQHLHWLSLVSAYENSPFFEYYADDFRPFYERKFDFLIDFNEQLCDTVCRLLGLDVNMARTSDYADAAALGADDFRDTIHPKRAFDSDAAFRVQTYYQVFAARNGFKPNLSIADLLFNEGPEALIVLHKSICSDGAPAMGV